MKKFEGDFEIKASKKMLYPYISTASGLAQWFADDVNINEDKEFNFIYDGEDHPARMASHRLNQYVKFEFFEDEDEDGDVSYVELHLDENEITQSVYLKVVDFSDYEDDQEQYELWEDLVHSLKDIVGG
ncbi:hypothetical protein GCM10027429_33850 [Marivirga atlantica]|jgi:uncharacterized protein YndB with AHSA1/START domain